MIGDSHDNVKSVVSEHVYCMDYLPLVLFIWRVQGGRLDEDVVRGAHGSLSWTHPLPRVYMRRGQR